MLILRFVLWAETLEVRKTTQVEARPAAGSCGCGDRSAQGALSALGFGWPSADEPWHLEAADDLLPAARWFALDIHRHL